LGGRKKGIPPEPNLYASLTLGAGSYRELREEERKDTIAGRKGARRKE